MKKTLVVFAVVLSSLFSVQANSLMFTKPTAFVNVSVIPMDKERVLTNQTVVVRGGLITEIGSAKKVKIPPDAVRIDGTGKFLIPGLVDMHAHLLSDNAFPKSYGADELKIMLANGVTTIRLMIGTPEHLLLREQSARGEIVAPTLFLASPHLTGFKQGNDFLVNTEEAGREAVRKSKQAGYDFIKVTTFIKAEVYEAIVDEAKKQNIRVVGHADSRFVGLERAFKSGQQVEHLDGYLEAVLADNAPMKGSVSDLYIYNPKNWESLDYVDESKIAAIAKASVAANPFSCPTQHFMKRTFGVPRSEESIKAQRDFRFYPQTTTDMWLNFNKNNPLNGIAVEKRAKWIAVREKIIKAIHDAGGKMMTGSDTPDFLWLHGYTVHRELKALSEAGLSNYAVLEAATRNPSMFFGTIEKVGTIEKGKRADLVLLDANPLENIENTERRSGVMLKGAYYSQTELNRWLDETAPKFQKALEVRQQEAAAEIEKLGGKIEYNADKKVIKIDLNNTKITDADLKNLEPFTELQWLDLRITQIGDEGVFHLKPLKKLKFLNLFRTNLSDAGLAQLKNLTELETLLIGGTKITDDGLKNLEKFSKLRKMSLFRTAISDAGLKHIEKLPSLEVLLIGGSKITEDGAKSLQKVLPNIKFSEQT